METAMRHVLKLKLSVLELEPRGLAWVLMRQRLRIVGYPSLGASMSVLTHPSGFEKLFTYRDFHLMDENGNLLATLSTTWLLLDIKTRRMTGIPSDIREQIAPSNAFDHLPRPVSKLERFERIDHEINFRVGWQHLDFNGHMNNIFYVGWLLEAVPDEILMHHRIKEMDLIYKAESIWKDEISSRVQDMGDGSYLHQMVRLSDGKELMLARSVWE